MRLAALEFMLILKRALPEHFSKNVVILSINDTQLDAMN
jgi:hypothetical protein